MFKIIFYESYNLLFCNFYFSIDFWVNVISINGFLLNVSIMKGIKIWFFIEIGRVYRK